MPKAADFLPSRYSSKTSSTKTSIKTDPKELEAVATKSDKVPTTPFAGLGDDDSKEIPNYSVAKMTEAGNDKVKFDSVPDSNQSSKNSNKNNPQIKKRKNNITGLVALLFLVVGVAASYFLINQNQDLRQQANYANMECDPVVDIYCECDSTGCYSTQPGPSADDCPDNYYMLNGSCYHISCADGICGGSGDGDPCTQDSYGGDWCDDPTTSRTETCGEMGLIRCQCGPGSDQGWWVIGRDDGEGCSGLCDEAEIDCDDCPPETTPTDHPTGTPTDGPTETPTPIACGETGCQVNADCATGLTCQEVSINDQTTGICALGTNQLFCAAEPNTANCCEEVTMPVCNSIDMLNVDNTLMSEDDDKNLSLGDQVKFQCSARGTLTVDFDYKFRILTPSGLWVDITDTNNLTAKNISAPYTINEYGPFVAQARICVGDDCQSWESVPGAPPATLNCQTDDDCRDGYFCYQPAMPSCPPGLSCVQVMPDKICQPRGNNEYIEID